MEKIRNWFSAHKRELIFGVIIFFAASLSFASGYLVAGGFTKTPIIIEECAAIHNQAQGQKENPH